jgi:hypothetical protein
MEPIDAVDLELVTGGGLFGQLGGQLDTLISQWLGNALGSLFGQQGNPMGQQLGQQGNPMGQQPGGVDGASAMGGPAGDMLAQGQQGQGPQQA